MAACNSRFDRRRRWLLILSSVAVMAVFAVGALLWQAVEFSSLTAVSVRVEQMKPLLTALRLALIGALAVAWPRLLFWFSTRTLRVRNDETTRARWLALRWRVVGWLLVIELMLGQNLLSRFSQLATHSA